MKTYLLPITPQTQVRTVQRDKILFQIPEECPFRCGKPRKKTVKDSDELFCKHCLSHASLMRKKRIERYNDYKDAVYEAAKTIGFDLPAFGATVRFYIPMPKKWNKAKRKAHHMQWHMRTPDWDNLYKALSDGLLKQDAGIAQADVGKMWVDSKNGWIEIKVPDASFAGLLPTLMKSDRITFNPPPFSELELAKLFKEMHSQLQFAPQRFKRGKLEFDETDPHKIRFVEAADGDMKLYDGLKIDRYWMDEMSQFPSDKYMMKISSRPRSAIKPDLEFMKQQINSITKKINKL